MTYKFNSIDTTAKSNNDFDYSLNLGKLYNTSAYDKKTDYVDDILKKISNIFSWNNTSTDPNNTYTLFNVTPQALNMEWNKAATRLYDYLYYSSHPSYDFKIGNIPVKIHGNYIQIGSKIVPKFTSSSYFKNWSKKDRITIYNISLTINSVELAA